MNLPVEFKLSPIHGWGGFATAFIASGTRILEYAGERISKEESNRRLAAGNSFLFYLDETWNLDGSAASNPARLLNHSCDPNSEAVLDEGRIWITATRSIQEGEEITFNYGYDLEDFRQHPCRCGARNCVGYILAAECVPEFLRRPLE